MEVLSKRRASTEVQELMNAVKNDYEFFERFDSAFQGDSAIKRQRIQNDNVFVQYAFVKPKLQYQSEESQLFKPSNGKYLNRNIRFHENNLLPELHVAPESKHRNQSHEELQKSRELLEFPRDQNEKTSEQEQIFRKITPDFWASHGDEKSIIRRPCSFKTTKFECERPNSNYDSSTPVLEEDTNPRDFICLSSESFISRGAHAIVGRKRTVVQKPNHLPPVTESPDEPPFLIRFDPNNTREVPKNEAKTFGGFPTNKTPVYNSPAKIQQVSADADQEIVQKPINVEKKANPAKKMPSSDSEDEIIVVDTTPIPTSSQSYHSQSPTNKRAGDNHVISAPTNKKPEKSKEVLPIERKSPDGGSPLSLSPTDQIWPDCVITRVGSLLWLDKEVVYPITLDEMRRRIQDPENFSFQMLIAYVRHSRAKGRQFLDYWKCQPSGKTSRPNVLSKLCEADAKELVKGIENVHEEYFPHEALAKNAAANIFQVQKNRLTAHEEEGKEAKELAVRDKVKAIEKSRSVFKTLQVTLSETQDDECFNAFNMASHNAGVENLKNSLKFLDSIFGRIQNYVQGNHKSLPALTA